jgi:hypothetical protein
MKIKKGQEIKVVKRKKFLDEFEKFLNENIKPVMEETGQALKEKGHDFNIYYRRENKDEKGGILDSRITMDIFPNGKSRVSKQELVAHVLFFVEKDKDEIRVHEKTPGVGSGRGTASAKSKKYTLISLTMDDIEKEIIESIGNIFQNGFSSITTVNTESHTQRPSHLI